MSAKILAPALLGATLLALGIGGWLTQPPTLAPESARLGSANDLRPDTVKAYLHRQEAAAASKFGIVDGAEKRIRWVGVPGARSDYVVVYLHGFSATRQEIAPLPEQVALSLAANLFETRLSGHGRKQQQLENIRAEDWMADGAEAIAVAKTLGDRIVLMGTSTGATLALAMARHRDFALIDSLILVSPNFGPAGQGAGITTGPFGPQLTRLILGPRRSWVAANPLQEKYWSTNYPTDSVVEMMRLVDLAAAITPEARVPKALLIYSPQDDVVSVSKLLAGFEQLPATQKSIHVVDKPESLSPHVLTGDILAPGTSAEMAELIATFVDGPQSVSGRTVSDTSAPLPPDLKDAPQSPPLP